MVPAGSALGVQGVDGPFYDAIKTDGLLSGYRVPLQVD